MNNIHKVRLSMKINPLNLILLAVIVLCLALTPGGPVTAAEPVTTSLNITLITPSPAYIGQQVEIHIQAASVNPLNGNPTGQVELRSGQNRICTITLAPAGDGFCTLSFDDPGTVPLQAIYLGKDAFLPAVSAEINLVVKNKHTPLVEVFSHLPDPSTINSPVTIGLRTSSDGPVPTGSVTIWRSNSNCSVPSSTTAVDRCSINLTSGAGSCSIPLTAPGDIYLCAAYSGDSFTFPARAEPARHFVSNSNTFTVITKIEPEPSVPGQTVWVYYTVGSPIGTPLPSDLVRVTSGALTCTGTVSQGRCPLTFTIPHLHDIVAAYQGSPIQQVGSVASAPVLEPSRSRAYVHRVNAPPTSIDLTRSEVDIFTPIDQQVAVLTAADPNIDETHSYSLVPGAGSLHNMWFRIRGNQLLLAKTIPYNYSTLSLRIRATDPTGLTFERAFSIQVQSAPQLPETGFLGNHITTLPSQPADKRYQKFSATLLDIPVLDLQAEITGVPSGDEGWDATWLWNQVGWLGGTAFPGWRGNAVLAAHNYLPSGDPGPFSRLHELRWGDQILVHSHGETSVFEVRSVETVSPDQSSVLGHEEAPWITLITCKTFNEASGTYLSRVVVRAQWVEVR